VAGIAHRLPQGQGTLPLSPAWIDVRPTRDPAVQPAKTSRAPRYQFAHANSAASPSVPRHGRPVRAMRRGSSMRDCAKPMRPSRSESWLLARAVPSGLRRCGCGKTPSSLRCAPRASTSAHPPIGPSVHRSIGPSADTTSWRHFAEQTSRRHRGVSATASLSANSKPVAGHLGPHRGT
jgi:hypothetical protein